MHPQPEQRVGLEYVAAVTTLLQRVRLAHPTFGLYEAADLQWWWSHRLRSTDDLPQLFWFDGAGQPEAAVVLTEWDDRVQFDPFLLPGASPDFVGHVVETGLAHAAAAGFDALSLEADPGDTALWHAVESRGFVVEEQEGYHETWLDADARPAVSPLADGYRLTDRLATADRPHHMINLERGRIDPEPRLLTTSLYRPDLDLVVLDEHDAVAAYGLFWYDPVPACGLVEPMRTNDDHQRRGLARHVLTAGLERLAAAGAERVKICFEPGNPASGPLYLSVGFEPDRQTQILAGAARA